MMDLLPGLQEQPVTKPTTTHALIPRVNQKGYVNYQEIK